MLVMSTHGILVPEREVFDETWTKIGEFLPELKEQMMTILPDTPRESTAELPVAADPVSDTKGEEAEKIEEPVVTEPKEENKPQEMESIC